MQMSYSDDVERLHLAADNAAKAMALTDFTDMDSVDELNRSLRDTYGKFAKTIGESFTNPKGLGFFNVWTNRKLEKAAATNGARLKAYEVSSENGDTIRGYIAQASFKHKDPQTKGLENKEDTVVLFGERNNSSEKSGEFRREVSRVVYDGYTSDAKAVLFENYKIINSIFRDAYGKDFEIPDLAFENGFSDFHRTHFDSDRRGVPTIVLRADAFEAWESGGLSSLIAHELSHAMFNEMLKASNPSVDWQSTDNFIHEKRFGIDEAVALACEHYVRLAKGGKTGNLAKPIAVSLLNNICYNCSVDMLETEKYHQSVIENLGKRGEKDSEPLNLDSVYDKLYVWQNIKGESYFKYNTMAAGMARLLIEKENLRIPDFYKAIAEDLVESERQGKLVGSAEFFGDDHGRRVSLNGNEYYEMHKDGDYMKSLTRFKLGFLAVLHGRQITTKMFEGIINRDHYEEEYINGLLKDSKELLSGIIGIENADGSSVKEWLRKNNAE